MNLLAIPGRLGYKVEAQVGLLGRAVSWLALSLINSSSR